MIVGAAAMAIFMFLAIIGIAILVFEILMFIDAIRNPHLDDKEKILWCLGMLLLHPFVAIFYYFLARSSLEKPAAK